MTGKGYHHAPKHPAYTPTRQAVCISPGADPTWWDTDLPDTDHLATAACKVCPDLHACLDWAVTNREPEGIWGATTPEERTSPADVKQCRRCLRKIFRGNRTPAEFARRRYCSLECANAAQRRAPLAVTEKPCPSCGAMFGPREKEKPSHFLKRKFCKAGCATEQRKARRAKRTA